ncbi:hypothetical protein CKO12_14280 [Chromatium okenii]|nr:hypothetical protein [Chromatium okenii]
MTKIDLEYKDEPAKCTEQDYIQFLIANPRTYSCTKAAKVSPKFNHTFGTLLLSNWNKHYGSENKIVRNAVRFYLSTPLYDLFATA